MLILGIDPGIANTGLAVVTLQKYTYRLKHSELVTTSPKRPDGWRLLDISEAVNELLDTKGLDFDAVAIERIYHNQNVSSSIKTAKAIGACMVAAAHNNIPVIELTPQQVKCASGLSSKASKQNLICAASRLFGTKIVTHHEADAAFCAVAGILQARKA